MTTIPQRIEHIKPCIDSLLRQGMDIYLWIGDSYKRAEGKIRDIPKFLEHEKIHVNRVVDDGSITKLYPALGLYEVDRIITADDDIIYPPDWAKNLLNASIQIPESAICYRGRNFRYGDKGERLRYRKTKLIKGRGKEKVDIITGVHGALYRSHFFGDDFFNYRNYEISKFVDDIWISGYLEKKGIDKVCIKRGNIQNAMSKKGVYLHTIDPLVKHNWGRGRDHNEKMIKELGVWG
jgi:hypothetical protein